MDGRQNEPAWELPVPLRPAYGARLKCAQMCTTLQRRTLADSGPRGAHATPLPAGSPGLAAQLRNLQKPRPSAKRRLPEPRVRREAPTLLYQQPGQQGLPPASPTGSPKTGASADPADPSRKVVLKFNRPRGFSFQTSFQTTEDEARSPTHRAPSPTTPYGGTAPPPPTFWDTIGSKAPPSSADHMSVYLPPIAGAAGYEDREETGFDTLLHSLEWMVRKKEDATAGSESLQQAWEEAARQLVRWRDDGEVRRVIPLLEVIASASESLLDAGDMTGTLSERDLRPDAKARGPSPNTVHKAAVTCAACLRPLLRIAARAHPQLERCTEATERALLACLFLRPPAEFEFRQPSCRSSIGGQGPLSSAVICSEGTSVDDLVAPFRGKRTYAQAAGMLSRRLAQQGDLLDTATKTKDRAAAGMERISRYWKFHLQGVLFRVWRASCRKRRQTARDDELLKARVAELEEKHKKLNRESADKLQRSVAEVEQLRVQLSGINDIHKKLLKEKETVKALNEKVEAVKEEMEKQAQAYEDKLEDERDKYAQLVKVFERTQHSLLGSTFEQDRRLKYANLLERDIDEKAMLEWLNAMIQEELVDRVKRHAKDRKWKKSPFTDMSYHLTDFCQGAKALDCYWGLLAAMSPGHVPDDMLLRNWQETDAATKAKRLLVMVEEMGMHIGLDYNNVLAESAENHEILVSTLFNRWCGATPAVVQFKPAESSEQRRASTMPPSGPITVLDVEELEELSAKKEEQQALWRMTAKKATKNVMAKVTEVMKTGNSSALNSEEQSDWQMFTDISLSVERLPKELKPEDIIEINEVLRTSFRKTRKVFLRYAGDDKDMSQDEFWRMASDAKTVDKHFNRKNLAEVFEAANTGDDPTDVQLDGGEWIVAIVRLALAKLRKAQSSPAEKVSQLLERHLFLYCTAETDEFKLQIYQPAVQDRLQKNKNVLKKIFRLYAADEGHGQKQSNSVAELSSAEFRKLVRDAEITDSVCTFAALDTLFSELQGDLQVRGGTGMLYHEFAELVCGMAVFKYPLPTLPMHMKLHNFLEKLFLPKIQPKLR
eukprot:Hpha_TRINITY_DN15915_c2_g2::TRINITY_DN15915_c2_g2_i1::g.73224::m.73224